MLADFVYVQAVFLEDAAVNVGHRHDLGSEFGNQLGGPRTDVAKTLDRHLGVFDCDSECLTGFARDDHRSATRGLIATEGAAQVHGFSGHDRRAVAVLLAVLVHDPGHDLGVGIHIRRGDVAIGPEGHVDFLGEATRQGLKFRAGHFGRVAGDASLGAAKGYSDEGGLPGHQGRQRADFVQVDLVMKSEAALVGPAYRVVLYTIAVEEFEMPVVHADRDLHDQLAIGRPQEHLDFVLEIEVVEGDVELLVGDSVEVYVIDRLGFVGRRSLPGSLRKYALGCNRHRQLLIVELA